MILIWIFLVVISGALCGNILGPILSTIPIIFVIADLVIFRFTVNHLLLFNIIGPILIGAMLCFLGHPVQSCVLLGIGCFSCGSMADCMISDLIEKDNDEAK